MVLEEMGMGFWVQPLEVLTQAPKMPGQPARFGVLLFDLVQNLLQFSDTGDLGGGFQALQEVFREGGAP